MYALISVWETFTKDQKSWKLLRKNDELYAIFGERKAPFKESPLSRLHQSKEITST